jgi:hypothetical protein
MENQLSETYTNIVRQFEGGGTVKDVRSLPGSFSNETTLIAYDTAVGPKQIVVRRYAVFGDYDRGETAAAGQKW